MSERHQGNLVKLFKGLEEGEHYSKFGKVVEISRGDIRFVGYMVKNSIAIPTDASGGADPEILSSIGANLEVVRENSLEPSQPAVCHLLGLPYFGNTEGLYSDGEHFSNISGVHFHPKVFVKDQEDFVKLVVNSLKTVGSELTILE